MEGEPLAGQQVNAAVLPPKRPAPFWTPGFSLLFTLVALLGIAATLFGVVERPGEGGLTNSLQSTHQATALLNVLLAVVCLGGLRLVSNTRLRSGLLIRAIVAIYSLVTAAVL